MGVSAGNLWDIAGRQTGRQSTACCSKVTWHACQCCACAGAGTPPYTAAVLSDPDPSATAHTAYLPRPIQHGMQADTGTVTVATGNERLGATFFMTPSTMLRHSPLLALFLHMKPLLGHMCGVHKAPGHTSERLRVTPGQAAHPDVTNRDLLVCLVLQQLFDQDESNDGGPAGCSTTGGVILGRGRTNIV